MNKQCDGWRRYGSAFSFGPPRWEQCGNNATVILTIVQDGETSQMTACNTCWEKALDTPSIIIKSAGPSGRVNQHEMSSDLTTILREAVNLLKVHRSAFEDEAANTGCDAGNPNGGSTQDCSHCQLIRAIEEIDQILNKAQGDKNIRFLEEPT